MQFRLRYGAHDIELFPGDFIIGRSEECQLALDDPMVSRKHLCLRVSSGSVVAVDLGSRNGVTINGSKLKAERPLTDGDRVKIGQHELVLQIQRQRPNERRLSTRTLQAVDVRDLESTAVKEELQKPSPAGLDAAAKAAASFGTFAQLANKAFGMGRVDEAERILTRPLNELLEACKSGPPPAPALLEKAASYALRVATESGKPNWIDYIIELYSEAERLFPAQLLEDIHGAARKVKGAKRELLERYIGQLTRMELTASERFLLQRIQGLRPLLS